MTKTAVEKAATRLPTYQYGAVSPCQGEPEVGMVMLYRNHDSWMAEWVDNEGIYLFNSWQILQEAKTHFQTEFKITKWVRDHNGRYWQGFYEV